MSRAQRRQNRPSTAPKTRRTPKKAPSTGREVPWVPIGIAVGVLAVVGLVAYLLWQQTQPASTSDKWAKVEANANPDIPGEFVDLQTIYDEPEGYPDTASHVRRDVDYAEEQDGLPAVGGPHWGDAGSCPADPSNAPQFCGPVPGGFYVESWAPESLVHNMEHAGVVVWYNTDDQAMIDEMRDFAKDHQGPYIVVSRVDELDEDTVAITSWSRRLVMSVEDYDREAFNDFFDSNNCRFDPEGFC